MKSGECQVMGITRVEGEKGVSYTLHAVTPFEDWECNGDHSKAVGLKCISEWTRLDLSALKPNMVIRLRYGKGFKGQAVLSGYDEIKSDPPWLRRHGR